MGVVAEDGRHLGFLTLLTDDPALRTPEHSDVLGRLRPLLARALLAVVRTHAGGPGARSSFLCPANGDLLRSTVLDCRDESTDHLSALVP